MKRIIHPQHIGLAAPAIAIILVNIFFLILLSYPAMAQQRTVLIDGREVPVATAPTETVTVTDKYGNTIEIASEEDLDGDGVPNWLEIGGYYYNAITGLQPCDPAVDIPCYVTDYTQWSTDGDPFSDFHEVSKANMPVGAPYNHPLVAAEHIIAVNLADYTITPRQTITDAKGGSFGAAYQNSTTNTYEESISVTATAAVGPSGLFGYSATGSATETTANTSSTTRNWDVDWNTATTVDLNAAADLSLSVFIRNLGSAQARNVRLFFNLKIGNRVIASIRAPLAPGLIDSGEQYPSTAQGPWVIKTIDNPDGSTSPITISMDQLKALESGAPLKLAVTAVEADILRWNPQGGGGAGSWECDEGVGCDWNAYQSRIKASTIKLDIHIGNEHRQYRVFGGKSYGNPSSPDIVMTLRDVLDLVLDVQGPNDNATIEGRAYPSEWYAMTSSEKLIQNWDAAGSPPNILDLEMAPGTTLRLTSPSASPEPIIDLATFSPDLRHVYVSARAADGFPIREITANVTVGGEQMSVPLELGNNAFYTNSEPFTDPAAAGAMISVQNVRGDITSRSVALPVSVSANCNEIQATYALVFNGEYILFKDLDESKPMRAYCRFPQAGLPQTYFWIDRTPSFVEEWAGTFRGVTYVDENTAFAVGSASTRVPILRTRDGGASWDSVTVIRGALEEPALVDIAFDDEGRTGLAVGFSYNPNTEPSSGFAIFRTTNGGSTWVAQATFPVLVAFPSFDYVAYAGNGNWFVAGGARFMRSVDNGVSWQDVTSPNFPDEYPRVADIEFKDHNTGFAVIGWPGEYFGLFTTEDGGDTWELQQEFDADFTLNDLSYVGGSTWYGGMRSKDGVEASVIFRTDDDWQTWTYITNLAEMGAGRMQNMKFLTDDIGYVFDQTYDHSLNAYVGTVWRTGDGGDSWSSERLMDAGIPRGIAMYDVNRGIIASSNGVLITTSGGGSPTPVPTSIPEPDGFDFRELPQLISLGQNYPNPFNPTTTISFTLAEASDVTLSVFDLLGRRVGILQNGRLSPGTHTSVFDARHLSSGVYLYRIEAAGFTESRKMMLLK
ncbi:MAG: T9SS C-terminal target domain-containing protein [Balneolaceae bacterium]|nr:MAG: T9SS C-terminal target domain-containing protein [Balneolaceae bacterium]